MFYIRGRPSTATADVALGARSVLSKLCGLIGLPYSPPEVSVAAVSAGEVIGEAITSAWFQADSMTDR
jgi:hypothetical protein